MLLTLQFSADVTMSFTRIVGHCYAFGGCSHPLAIVQCSAIHLPAMFITKIVCIKVKFIIVLTKKPIRMTSLQHYEKLLVINNIEFTEGHFMRACQ